MFWKLKNVLLKKVGSEVIVTRPSLAEKSSKIGEAPTAVNVAGEKKVVTTEMTLMAVLSRRVVFAYAFQQYSHSTLSHRIDCIVYCAGPLAGYRHHHPEGRPVRRPLCRRPLRVSVLADGS